jgi:heterodisulfide reductase subunit B
MNVTYYPGCSLKGTARDYAASVEAVCNELGIELCELDDWNCCGATAAHSLDHRTAIHLAGRNLVLAEETGLDMLVPCPLCFNRLKTAQKELLGERKRAYEVSLRGPGPQVWDLANFLAREDLLAEISRRASQSLKGLKAVCYYGCMASRPPRITGEREYENPQSMDRILRQLGVEAIPWSYKTDCCGASHLVARPDIVYGLVGKLYREAFKAGAQCIVVSCQMCQANLDLHQRRIMETTGLSGELPVIYLTELIGLALAHGDATKWFKRHLVDPTSLVMETCGMAPPAPRGEA